MRRSVLATAVGSVGVLVASALVSASPASAGQTWHQSVERSSASAECPASAQGDREAGWTDWAPSWEEWAKNGKGGYVCSRQITWAKDTPPPGSSPEDAPVTYPAAGCVPRGGDFPYFIDFGDSYFVSGAGHTFSDDQCQTPEDISLRSLVYAPAPLDADAVCIAAFGSTGGAEPATQSEVIYVCNID